MYGKGVYFARDASYSAYPKYSVPDSKGRQYMLACRVVVGEYCSGKVRWKDPVVGFEKCSPLTIFSFQMDALTPDIRDYKTHALYDSTVNDLKDPSIYVTYHDAQAYPEVRIFECNIKSNRAIDRSTQSLSCACTTST